MEISQKNLANNYATKPDEELLRLHSSGTLTDLAYDTIEVELESRASVDSVPDRPEPKVHPHVTDNTASISKRIGEFCGVFVVMFLMYKSGAVDLIPDVLVFWLESIIKSLIRLGF